LAFFNKTTTTRKKASLKAACPPTPEPWSNIMLRVQWLLASFRCPLCPFETPAWSGARQTPEKKNAARGAKSRALPAHLGDVARDLGRFSFDETTLLRLVAPSLP
jgi:hypothetical protein